MVGDGPGDGGGVCVAFACGAAVSGLQASLDVEEDGLHGEADEDGRAAAEAVEPEDGGQGEGCVEDVLD